MADISDDDDDEWSNASRNPWDFNAPRLAISLETNRVPCLCCATVLCKDPSLLWKATTWDLCLPFSSSMCSSVPLGPSSLQGSLRLLPGVPLPVFVQWLVCVLTLRSEVTPQLCFYLYRNLCFSCYISLSGPDTQEMLWLAFCSRPIRVTGREGKKSSLDAETSSAHFPQHCKNNIVNVLWDTFLKNNTALKTFPGSVFLHYHND